jgi:hypothetical protein
MKAHLMIEVKIDRSGVNPEIYIYGSDHEQDEAMLLWPIVREELRRLDKRLKTVSTALSV